MNKYVKQAVITLGVMFALNYMPPQIKSVFRGTATSPDTGGMGTNNGIAV